MASKPINTSGIQGGTFDAQLNEDAHRFHKQPNQWTQARNAVNNTIRGDVGDLSNEMANYLCTKLPYTIIGAIHVGANDWAIFSTDNVHSEIGLFIEGTCTYTKIVNDPCLNFHKENLIKGVGRTAFNCGRRIYWDDSINPSRVLDIDDVPWKENCTTDPGGCVICIPTNQLDCDKLRLASLMTDLSFRCERGNSSGQLLNGSYYVVGAYLVEGQRVSDYSLPSNIQSLFTHDNLSSSLDIFIEEADQTFDEFELVLVQFANFNTVAKKIGVYSTRQKKISLDMIDEKLEDVDPGLILLQHNIPDKSDAIYRTGDYLLRVGPTDKFDFNYQPLANQINTNWVSVEYDDEYYRKGGHNTGYMRDEVYAFFIRWVFNTGDKSRSYHIPGRVALPSDLVLVSGSDVIAGDDPIMWKVYNTASIDPSFPGVGTITPDGGKVLGGGKMGYWESSEFYDDDKPQVWNASSRPFWGSMNPAHDLCGRNLRHHKFPDNALDTSANMITNHYDPNDATKIRIMGVVFDNIKAPLDNHGQPITNIVGYEILRGSRDGNKTVLAKGMINNLREYVTTDKNPTKRFLYPNYPYNPTAPGYKNNDVVDHFLSSTSTMYDSGGVNADGLNNFNAYLEQDTPLGTPYNSHFNQRTNILKNMLTFHSPETNFRSPFLSAKELKVYGELHGSMIGQFQFPKDHPRHKFITNTSFVVSAVLGVGYAIISTQGAKTTSYTAPQVDMGGTFTQVGVSSGTTGLYGVSAGAAASQLGAKAITSLMDTVSTKLFSHSILSILLSITGINPTKLDNKAKAASSAIAGAIGGIGGQNQTSQTTTPWGASPDLLKVGTGSGITSFLTFWAEGIDKIINVIYAFTPYRQYALQQISHCFYNAFARPDIGDMRRAIEFQNYLSPELQDFARDYRINNIYRSRTVALKLEADLHLPYKQIDNTQALFSDVWDRSTDSSKWANDQHINDAFERPASSHYVAMKQRLDNQYGQLAGIMQVPVSTSYTDKIQKRSDILFNGDIYIGRYTEKNTMFFFYDWLKGQPDGTSFNYKLRKMITHPRFWMDTDPFDIGEFVASIGNIFSNTDVPGDFDPFMVNQKLVPETIPATDPNDPPVPNPNYVPLVTCDCNNYSTTGPLAPCYFSTIGMSGELGELCDLEEEITQLKLYQQFLIDCACFKNTDTHNYDDANNVEGCNESGTIPDPASDPAYVGICTSTYTDGCSVCPTWTGGWGSTSQEAGQYINEDKGSWARHIRRIDRKIERAQKKLEKKKSKLYDKYIEDISGQDHDGFLKNLIEKLVTPNDKFGFDMKTRTRLKLTVKQAFMYLFNSGVRDFFVETEINLDQRDWGNKPEERHYDHLEYTNLRDIFSTDHIKVGNYLKYDYSLSIGKLFNNYISWGVMQDRNYDPEVAETCYLYRPKRVLYSLPQSEENKKDNWKVFLPMNYKDFSSVTTNIKAINKSGALLLFANESPVQFLGVDQLQTDAGTKLTIGDGGLFSQPLQNLVNADYPHEYGSCQHGMSAVNTPAGLFYISQNQGKIFQVGGSGLRNISDMGMKWWFSRYLPYKLTQHPTFNGNPFQLIDNPVIGIGCQTIFDNQNQVVFFCKKDWTIREDIGDVVTYLGGNRFRIGPVLIVELGDPRYFKPASWTVSWDPKANEGQGAWISYHDWHPDLVLPSKGTYMTIKNDGIWEHANRCDLYCNYYGEDKPFEVEFSLHTPTQITTLKNIMYLMEVYKYDNNCYDRYHVLDFNFDEAIIYNSEQCSGLLRLNLLPKNNAPLQLQYPLINATNIDILFAKEEHRYRFNQFWDITDDRGEFNSIAQRMIFNTEDNGYVRNLNPNNLNYNKFALERKKFRHYKHTVLLRRRVCGDKNMIISAAVQTNLNSER